MKPALPGFAARVVRWQAAHGRNHLPWQNTRDPYRVWLSEIMLQQTQVSAVLDYYPRFLARFPDVASLAAAPLDDVFALWSGLGYYSRARNLHRCAQEVVARHGGAFPRTAEELQTLPGIGRSTAAAIAAFCFGERAAILDGNVKRVLTRALGYGADLASATNEKALWSLAEGLLPTLHVAEAMPRYTQGLMDLGATVCLPRSAGCLMCPVSEICVARAEGDPQRYPVKTRKLKRTAQALWLLQARNAAGEIWLEKRPPHGVWAGLYCLPAYESREALEAALALGGSSKSGKPGARGKGAVAPTLHDGTPFLHVLTHKDLHLHPVEALLDTPPPGEGAWFGAADWPLLGLPAPIRRLLEG